jgi:hypothetical protein
VSDRTLEQADECLEIAKQAQASGDNVTFIAATGLAAQLIQLARIQDDTRRLVGAGLEKGRRK